MSDAIVFLGPTLRVGDARQVMDADYWPPAQRGDVLRALYRDPQAIGIVDGYFHTVRSVWHKEILVALERGVRVYGAASMGALRAAELSDFGMVGIGEVFKAYKSGALTDDDEVAVVHAPEALSYQPLTEAMVDLRDAYLAAANAGRVQFAVAEQLICIAKALHYSRRSHQQVFQAVLEDPKEPFDIEGLRDFLGRYKPTLKQRDALAMLQEMAHPQPATQQARRDFAVERTTYLRVLEAEIFNEAFPWGRVTAVRPSDGTSSS